MTTDETLKNTKVRISDTVHINDQEVIVAQAMAIGPVAPGFTGVTLTIFTEDFDVDWKKVPSDIEIIAPDEMISQRATEVENFQVLAPHGTPVGENQLQVKTSLTLDRSIATPWAFRAAIEHLLAKGVPQDAELRVTEEGQQIRIATTWTKERKDD